MVSPSKPHHSRVASQEHLRMYILNLLTTQDASIMIPFDCNVFHRYFLTFQFSDKCKLVKGAKPLTHFKFYLDIEKHHIENKIEKTIRELGGVSKLVFV